MKLKIAWISDFPVEWLDDVPTAVKQLPRGHPASWQRVLLEELEKRPDVEVHVICFRSGIPEDIFFRRNGVSFYIKKQRGFRARSFFWRDTLAIRRQLAEIKPHVVHAWGTESGAALIARRCNYPYLITMQGILSWCVEMAPASLQMRLMAYVEKYSLQKAAFTSVESGFGKHYLHERFPRLKITQIEHAPAWIFHKVKRGHQAGIVRLFHAGTLSELKGTDLLFKALESLQSQLHFRLVLAGTPTHDFKEVLDGVLRSELGSCIDYIGCLSQDEIASEFERATFLILPSRADNSPNILKEAVVAGVPVIASNVGGIPEHIVNGQNGLLFGPGNWQQLAETIREACTRSTFSKGVDPDLLDRKRALLSPSEMAIRFCAQYRTLANGIPVAE